jgi:hypothetical protein
MLLQSHAFKIECFKQVDNTVLNKVSVDLDQGTAKFQLNYSQPVEIEEDDEFLKRMSYLIYLFVWLDIEESISDYVNKSLGELEDICARKEGHTLPTINYSSSNHIQVRHFIYHYALMFIIKIFCGLLTRINMEAQHMIVRVKTSCIPV